MSNLILERKGQPDKTTTFGLPNGPSIMLTPGVGPDYWTYRVVLTERQAVIGFPKFGTIGIGFAVEDADWNTNLPYTCGLDEIFKHISENKGDEQIPDDDVREAIRLIQAAATADRAGA